MTKMPRHEKLCQMRIEGAGSQVEVLPNTAESCGSGRVFNQSGAECRDEVAEVAVGNSDTLGTSSRARGVEEITANAGRWWDLRYRPRKYGIDVIIRVRKKQ